jgi:hypothetical protein
MAALFVNGRRVTGVELDPDHPAFRDEFPRCRDEAYVVFMFFEATDAGVKGTNAAVMGGRIHPF